MKLLIVSHFYDAHGGGIERVAAQLGRAMSRAGHSVAWAASDADPPPADLVAVLLPCIDLTERLTGLPMPVPGVKAVVRLARAVRSCDAVIINDALYVTSILALLLAKAADKRVVMIQHIAGIAFASRSLRGLMRFANLFVARPMLAATDRLVFISDAVRRETIGEPARRRFELLFNGVDPAIFHPGSPPDRAAARSAFGLPADAKLAVFVGRFVNKKGLTVLRALAALRPSLHVALIGGGPIRPDLWGLDNVHVLGRRSQESVAALYRMADVLLLPSVGEGFPLVIQEAMACGLPVVCGDASAQADPGAASFLRGVAIDLADPEGSAKRCAAAIDDLPGSVDLVGMAAYAAGRYSWPAMADGIVACLSESAYPLNRAPGRFKRR